MSLETLLKNSLFGKIVYAVAASAIIGGGTMVLNSQTRIAVLETDTIQETSRLERIENKIDALLERGR